MIIPISTDAPIYHWPWMTLVLIGANAVTFLATGFGHNYDGWILTYGQGLRPLEWVAYSFFHVNGFHLLTNAFFLWGFGIVVEGKLGWWKFLLLYLGIAIIGGVVIQGLMLQHKPRELPRLQIQNPNAAPATTVPNNDTPQNSPPPAASEIETNPPPSGQPESPMPGTNPALPQRFKSETDDEGDFENVDGPRRDRSDEFDERSRGGSVTDILFGNEHVFMKAGVKGASLMVYALLAITLVWAPRNEITCFVLKVPPGTFEAEYLYFCGFRVIIQILYAWLTDFRPTEEFGHFFGVVSGFGVGTLLLKRGWVDCENWDLFAVMRGTHGNRARVGGWQEQVGLNNEIATPTEGESPKKSSKKKKTAFRASIYASDAKPRKSSRSKSRRTDDETTESSELDDSFLDDWKGFVDDSEHQTSEADDSAEASTKPEQRNKNRHPKPKTESSVPAVIPILAPRVDIPNSTPVDPSTYATTQIRDGLDVGQVEVALQIYRSHKASNPNWDLDEADFVALSDALHKGQHWSDAAPLMEQCLQRFPDSSLRTRVKLAGIYVEIQRRPRAAMNLLSGISRRSVPEKLQAHFDAITKLAKQLIEMSIEDRDPPA